MSKVVFARKSYLRLRSHLSLSPLSKIMQTYNYGQLDVTWLDHKTYHKQFMNLSKLKKLESDLAKSSSAKKLDARAERIRRMLGLG